MGNTKRKWRMSDTQNSEKPQRGNGSELSGLVSRAGYMKGKHIETFTEFAERLEKGLPFYWRHKFMAAGFIEHWSVVMIKNAIKYRVLICADKYDG